MRTIIAGSRSGITMHHLVEAVTSCGWRPTVVLSGTARGADKLGEAWATWNSIPVERYPANWDLHGKSAGYKRNEDMANKAEALIALWDGESKGTKHMIDIARRKGLRVHVQMTTSNAEVTGRPLVDGPVDHRVVRQTGTNDERTDK